MLSIVQRALNCNAGIMALPCVRDSIIRNEREKERETRIKEAVANVAMKTRSFLGRTLKISVLPRLFFFTLTLYRKLSSYLRLEVLSYDAERMWRADFHLIIRRGLILIVARSGIKSCYRDIVMIECQTRAQQRDQRSVNIATKRWEKGGRNRFSIKCWSSTLKIPIDSEAQE